jgi:hypothetical protein
MSDLSARLMRIEEKLGETREDVACMRAEVAAFIAQASSRLEEAEVEARTATRQLKWLRVWAAAAVVLVPGTLGVVAWFLSAIPAAAWSHVAK